MTRRYAEVIGDPIAQSKSPAIHNFWLGKLGIDADYRACHVRPEDLADYLAARRADPLWRMDGEFARPATVSVSYGEAARWLDSGEQVDGVAMPREIADWVGDFVNIHYKPEPKKKAKRNDPLGLDRRRT